MDPCSEIYDMFDIYQNAFKNFETEYKALQSFENSGCLIRPISSSIGASINPQRIRGRTEMHIISAVIQVIPLKLIFKNFLELPGVLSSIKEHVEEVAKSEAIVSILQGELWQSIKQSFHGMFVLPIILNFDDFEINNPLGTHRGVHKMGAVYCTIGCLAHEYASKLENIFLVQLHNTKDHAEYGNKIVFAKVIEQIKELGSHGIIVDVDGSETQVYFALALITGDNLGIHTLFGLPMSFNATYTCRACTAEKPMSRTLLSENPELLRTVINYDRDVEDGTHGVQEECVFNVIESFHSTKNISFDEMHDIDEGICRSEIPEILYTCIYDDKLFSLETLNSRLYFFDFGADIVKNKPPPIKKESLQRKTLLYSASEMTCFVQYLGLIIGDLVPINHQVWQLYISLREIICIIKAPSFSPDSCDLLATLISEHHDLYMRLFQNPLKPKYHYLTHLHLKTASSYIESHA